MIMLTRRRQGGISLWLPPALFCVMLFEGCGSNSGEELQILNTKISSTKCYTVDGVGGKNITMCPKSHPELQDTLCYEKCKDGYKGKATTCWIDKKWTITNCHKYSKYERHKKCPDGYKKTAICTCEFKGKKSYDRGVGVLRKKACNVNYEANISSGCGIGSRDHCVVRNGQCVWKKSGYPLCKPHKGKEKWECCPTER